jgi:hypothetical protein
MRERNRYLRTDGLDIPDLTGGFPRNWVKTQNRAAIRFTSNTKIVQFVKSTRHPRNHIDGRRRICLDPGPQKLRATQRLIDRTIDLSEQLSFAFQCLSALCIHRPHDHWPDLSIPIERFIYLAVFGPHSFFGWLSGCECPLHDHSR